MLDRLSVDGLPHSQHVVKLQGPAAFVCQVRSPLLACDVCARPILCCEVKLAQKFLSLIFCK